MTKPMNWYIRIQFRDGKTEGYWVFDVPDIGEQLHKLIGDRWENVRRITCKR